MCIWSENAAALQTFVFACNLDVMTDGGGKPQSYVSNLFVGKQLSLLQQILVMRSFNLEPIQKE